MAEVVFVHGVGAQFRGEDDLLKDWLPAARDGLRRAGFGRPDSVDAEMAFYGHLFRSSGKKSVSDPPYDADDVTEEWECEWVVALWREAARTDPSVSGPDAQTKVRTPRTVQRALRALSHSKFFSGLALRALIADLKQTYAYLHDPEVRQRASDLVKRAIDRNTKVVVAHSLGSVVAYEALFREPPSRVPSLLTLGSPLGIRNLIFDRLDPNPIQGLGARPPGLSVWVNVADDGDVVCLEKRLDPRFSGGIRDRIVNNGVKAHSVRPYLTSIEVGTALADALQG